VRASVDSHNCPVLLVSILCILSIESRDLDSRMFSTSDLAQGIGKLKKAGQIRVRNSNGSIQYEERSEDGSLVLAASSITENFFEGSVYFDLNHVNQTETWDCGLSCLSMIFSYATC
jgi:hypothetical protein